MIDIRLFQHEDNTWDEPQYRTVRHNWKVLQLGWFTLLEVYYTHDVYDGGWTGITFLLQLLKSGSLLGLDIQTRQRDLGVYLFNWNEDNDEVCD